MAASLPFDHSRLDDASAVAFARADVLVCADDRTACRLGNLAATYYGFWNNGSGTLLEATVSPDYTDKTLPVGRQQGPRGLADAGTAFFRAFQDRIISHLRVTGTFTGERKGVNGTGQAIAYLATDIMRVANGLIVENWHVEDHETLHRQLAVPA